MTPELYDSHCHLEPKDFGDQREAVLSRAQEAGVTRLICIGSGASLDEVDNAVGLAETHDHIWAAVGIHPHDVARMPEGALDRIERLATSHPRVVAVGETGLDYHYDHSPPEAQKDALRTFAQIARRAQKPLSLHIRDAHDDALALLKEEKADELGGVVHCFTGTLDEAKRWVALGFAISFSGIVTFKSAVAIREACAWVPHDRVLLETDCPYLAPVPMRGKQNEPAYLVHTARVVAATRGVDLDQLAQSTRENTVRLFRLS